MAKTHQRVFALVAAMLFLATAVAGSVVVIMQIKKDNDASKAASQLSKAAQSATQQTTQPTTKENKLQGTKLANFTPVAKIDTLQSTDTVEGTGEVVKPGATVTAHYTGAVAATGVIFQSSHDSGKPVEFPLSNVIAGWTQGVPGMKVGGTRRLLIPYSLAYGDAGRPDGGIPAKADLVFDIELTAVKNP